MAHCFKNFLIRITSLCASSANWRPFSDLSLALCSCAQTPGDTKNIMLPVTSADLPRPLSHALVSPLSYSLQWLSLISITLSRQHIPSPTPSPSAGNSSQFTGGKKEKKKSVDQERSFSPSFLHRNMLSHNCAIFFSCPKGRKLLPKPYSSLCSSVP